MKTLSEPARAFIRERAEQVVRDLRLSEGRVQVTEVKFFLEYYGQVELLVWKPLFDLGEAGMRSRTALPIPCAPTTAARSSPWRTLSSRFSATTKRRVMDRRIRMCSTPAMIRGWCRTLTWRLKRRRSCSPPCVRASCLTR